MTHDHVMDQVKAKRHSNTEKKAAKEMLVAERVKRKVERAVRAQEKKNKQNRKETMTIVRCRGLRKTDTGIFGSSKVILGETIAGTSFMEYGEYV